jgi:hypothetical protein
MFSLDTIISIQNNATKKAARAKKFPYAPTASELSSKSDLQKALHTIPFVGEYVHPRWVRATDEEGDYIEWFVDSSGWGLPGEPALTLEQFTEKVQAFCNEHPGAGFGVVQAGQFQVYVAPFFPK